MIDGGREGEGEGECERGGVGENEGYRVVDNEVEGLGDEGEESE